MSAERIENGIRPTPKARVYSNDARLVRFFEIELAHLGVKPAADGEALISLIVADGDAWAIEALVREAAECECPLLVYGYEPIELPAGAGEYVRRPFALPALESALRRLLSGSTTTAAPLASAHAPARGGRSVPPAPPPLSLSPEENAALIGEHRVPLTPAEVAILRRLLERRDASPGEVVSREELSGLLGGGGNSVDVYVCHLRRKIEKPLGRRMIETVRGKGYRME